MNQRDKLLSLSGKREFATFQYGGETYRLRSITTREHIEAQQRFNPHAKDARADALVMRQAMFYAMTLVDEDGNPLFGTDEETLQQLASMPAGFNNTIDAELTRMLYPELEKKASQGEKTSPP